MPQALVQARVQVQRHTSLHRIHRRMQWFLHARMSRILRQAFGHNHRRRGSCSYGRTTSILFPLPVQLWRIWLLWLLALVQLWLQLWPFSLALVGQLPHPPPCLPWLPGRQRDELAAFLCS
jgi:hypothetical protein